MMRRSTASTPRTKTVLAAELVGLLLLLSHGESFSFAGLKLHQQQNQAAFVTSRTLSSSRLYLAGSSFDSFDDEDDDDDDDDEIDVDSLGDWRAFRRNLAAASASGEDTATEPSVSASSTTQAAAASKKPTRKSVSVENEELLESQNKELAAEYKADVWAHPVAVPEVGGLVVRMPLEVEIFRNHKHSLTGRKLRKQLSVDDKAADEPAVWYSQAQSLIEDEMLNVAELAGDDGQIDASTLPDDKAELLQLYLDNQESWQEVCLVVEREEAASTATTLVLNRPMALKLTENLAQLVLHGAFSTATSFQGEKKKSTKDKQADLVRFLLAFGQECAVYIGGPDDQDQPAELIHGIAELPGAVEISPGSGIYRGGIQAAIDGVLRGKYKPLDFRFFVGKHRYGRLDVDSVAAAASDDDDAAMVAAAAAAVPLDVSVVLGKYQPVACARSVALKQCLSLPKPLWHEVLELCDGELKDISQLELLKRDDIRFQIVDDDDDDDDDVVEFGFVEDIDELDELEKFDEEEDDFFK